MPRDKRCRCKVEWTNKHAVIVERLHKELMEA
jgi:hypothetical protein